MAQVLTSQSSRPVFLDTARPIFWFFLAGCLTGGLSLSILFSFSPMIPLLLAATFLAISLLARSPLLVLGTLIVVRMSLDYTAQFYTFSIGDITLSLSQIFGIGVALLGALLVMRHYAVLTRFPLLFPFALLLTWGTLTLSYSISPATSLQELIRIFDLFSIGFLAFLAVKDTQDIKKLFGFFLLSSLLPILFGIGQFIFHIGLIDPNVDTPRIFGTFSHPNVFSLYLFTIAVFAFSFFFFLAISPKEKRLSLFLFTVVGITLLLTFSRVAWIALFLFFLALGVFRYRLALIPLIFVPMLLFSVSDTFQSRVLSSFASDPDSSLVWRKNLWKDVTTQAFADQRQFVGTGLDTFPLVSESLRGIKLGSNEAHNDFVKFFIDGGFVGLVILLIFLASITFILARHARLTPDPILKNLFWFLLLLFALLEISALTDNVFKNTPVQWLFFALLGAVLGREFSLLKKIS
ncbi:MAG: hypothetical protein QG664_692 [Patescibacteria group bacterium]|nr:hypothetical protein [Patescibacteria group bacterium]